MGPAGRMNSMTEAGSRLVRGHCHSSRRKLGRSFGAEEGAGAREEDLQIKAADVVCAFNFSVCLLHKRAEVQVWCLFQTLWAEGCLDVNIYLCCAHPAAGNELLYVGSNAIWLLIDAASDGCSRWRVCPSINTTTPQQRAPGFVGLLGEA